MNGLSACTRAELIRSGSVACAWRNAGNKCPSTAMRVSSNGAPGAVSFPCRSLSVFVMASKSFSQRRPSEAAESGVALAMISAVAERLLQDPAALEKEPDVESVGDAHAAVHLHGFVQRVLTEVGGARLRETRERRGVARRSVVSGLQRSSHAAAQQLALDVQPRGAMLQRLERADRRVELHTLLEIPDGALESLADHAQQLCGGKRARAIEDALQRVERQVGSAQKRIVAE